MIGIGIGIAADFLRITSQQGGEEPPSYDADVQAWLDLITDKPSATQNDYVNTMIKDMKSGLGVERMMNWSDTFYHLAAETAEASLKNMVKDAHHAIAVNSPTFTPLEGWQGDGISAYLTTNYNGRVDADNLSLNDGAFGIYYRKTFDDGLIKINGAWSTRADGGTSNRIQHTTLGGGGMHSTASAGGAISPGDGGMKIVTRSSSSQQSLYVNKSGETFNVNSTKIPNQIIQLLALNPQNAPLANYFDTSQISSGFISRGLSSDDVAAIYDPFQALMIKNGKEV